MSRGKRRVLIGVGAFFGLATILLVLLLATLDQNKAKVYITAAVHNTTGRRLTINGDLRFNLGWNSRISAEDMQFANADWSRRRQMIEIGLVELQVDLWQLMTKFRLVFPRVAIHNPNVVLERNAQGSANWEFRGAGAATQPVPENRSEFPVIKKLVIHNGTLRFDNRQSRTQIELTLAQAEAEGFVNAPVKLRAEGAYQKLPLSIVLNGGSYAELKNRSRPYPLQIDLVAGKLKAKLDGTLTEPLEMKGENVSLDIQGDDMAKLYPLIRLVFPTTPPYRLKGRLKHEGKLWSFSNFTGRVGDSDLSGSISVDTAPARPLLKADLASNLLDFDDLAGFIGGSPDAGGGETASDEQKKKATRDSERLFPDQRYDLNRLRAMDADVRLRAKKILAPKLPIDNLNAQLKLSDGVLAFTPATFGVADGRVEIYSRFDGSTQPSKVKIDARLRRLDLKRFLPQNAFAEKTIGPIGGRVDLSGSGDSFRQLMATASGRSAFVMSGGEISELLVELAGLDVADALGVAARGDKPVPIRCALIELEGKNGQMDAQTLVVDTANSVITGGGSIDLRDERVNLVLLPTPKDFSPLSLRSYIRVTGGFKNISAFPDPIKTGADSLIKKLFNVLTVLVLSPLQPRDFGLGEDVDCGALMAKVKKQDPQGTILRDSRKPGTDPKVQQPAQPTAPR